MICERSAYAYCIEDISLIENYEEAVNSPIQWQCHHKLEIELNKSAKELIELGLYYHRPASELIFLTVSEHSKLHQSIKHNISNGEHLSEEHKRKISDAHKDKKLSDKTKQLISENGTKGKHRVYDNPEHTKYHYE